MKQSKLDPKQLKQDFPLLAKQPGLVYLDSAATSQKPQLVLDAINDYYSQTNANIGRGVYSLAEKSTQVFNQSCQVIADFFGAQLDELIPTPNTTAAINGVAYGWADHRLNAKDTILISLMEHHSNLVVWQQVCQRTGAKLEYVNLTDQGELDLQDLANKLKKNSVKLLALTHVSNVLGSVVPIDQVVRLVKKHSAPTKILIDAAQSVPHLEINFDQMQVDFLAFSGHKMLGPMGSGGLLVKKDLLTTEQLQPWFFGGGMVEQVELDQTQFSQDLPQRFMAGTPNVAALAGLAQACLYLKRLGMQQVYQHDQKLVKYALDKFRERSDIKLIGPRKTARVGSVAFVHQQFNAHDVAQVLDQAGVAVRSGYHCCHPLHSQFDWPATIRASFQVYNTMEDIDALISGLDLVNDKLK